MTGLKDFIYQYKDKVSDFIDDAQDFIGIFTDIADIIPDIAYMTAGDTVELTSDQFSYFKELFDSKLKDFQLLVPNINDGLTTAITCSGLIIEHAPLTDNFMITRLMDAEDPGSEHIEILHTSSIQGSDSHSVTFLGWDESMPDFSSIFENVVNSYGCQDIINQTLELLDQGALNCTSLAALFGTKYDKFSNDAKLLYNNLMSAVTVASPTNMLSTVWQVLKGTFSAWEDATEFDGTILFNNNDYSVNTMILPWRTIAKGAGAIISTVGAIISPIVGTVIYGISTIGSALVNALELNEGNEFYLCPDSERDNDCYSVPIATYTLFLDDDSVTIPSSLLRYLSKYGKAKMINGLYTIYAWIGDNIPYDEDTPFSSICFESYYSMLSGSEYTLTDFNSFISVVENAFNISMHTTTYFASRDVTTTMSLNTNLSINKLKINFEHGFGSRDDESTFDSPMGNAPELSEIDGNSRNRVIIRRLLMNTLLYLYTLACVHSDYPITETVGGTTYTLFNCNFIESIDIKENSKYDPYSSDYSYDYIKSIVPNAIDRFNRIISRFIWDCRDTNQQHFTFHYMPSASSVNPWNSDAAVIAAVINNWVLPAINDVFKHINTNILIPNRDHLGTFFFHIGDFPDFALTYENTGRYLNGCTNDFVLIPGISNAANPYCVPPKHTVNLWVRAAISTFAVASVTVSSLIIKSKIKKNIQRKAHVKAAEVKAKAEAFNEDPTKENFQAYRKAQRRYNKWWGKLSGLYYDGMNDWYDSSYDLAGGSVVSRVSEWLHDKMESDTEEVNSNVDEKTNNTNTKVDDIDTKVNTTTQQLSILRSLIDGNR